MLLNDFKKEIKVPFNNWAVECLSMLGIQTRRLSKLNIWPSSKKPPDPTLTGFLPTENLSLLLYGAFAERVGSVREINDPVNKNLLCLRRYMGLFRCRDFPRYQLQRVKYGITQP